MSRLAIKVSGGGLPGFDLATMLFASRPNPVATAAASGVDLTNSHTYVLLSL